MSQLLNLYQCPVCQHPLILNENSWCCTNNHSFDRHKKGYVNLLLAQNKRSKDPGDDAPMIISRRRFLEAGHYQPLAESLEQCLSQHLNTESSVLDAGCGEGYYTNFIAQKQPTWQVLGLDISKPAINAAAKYKNIDWCVASSTQPPFVDERFNAIFSVFSRVDSDSFHRILAAHGIVVMAAPDHDHLMALRSLIYDDVRPYDTSKHIEYFDQRFELLDQQRIEAPVTLTSNEALMDLLGMTPHAHRLSAATREKLATINRLNDTACFKVYCWKKA